MATRPYTSPIMEDLRALGVLFATPPGAAVNMAGIVFDGSGNPTQIQNPAGVLKDFPGNVSGGIPIPANNDGQDVLIQSGGAGTITITTAEDVNGTLGQLLVHGGTANSSGGVGSEIEVTGGSSLDSQSGAVTVGGGSNFTTGATGAQVIANGGNANGGDLELIVGGAGSGTLGNLVLRARTGNLAVPETGNDVITTAKGPAAGDVQITQWVPATLDGVAGFVPFFTVVP